jgi:hypothetical protein
MRRRQDDALDAHVAEEGAVVAAEVADQGPAGVRSHFEVELRYGRIVEDDVCVDGATHDDDRAAHRRPPRRAVDDADRDAVGLLTR